MSKPVMEYLEIKLASGRKVSIRSRTYEEWEKQEEARLKALEAVPNSGIQASDMQVVAALQRAQRTVRGMILNSCVKDFARLKSTLSLRDIAEIEQQITALEDVEIPLGNSEPGGDGQ